VAPNARIDLYGALLRRVLWPAWETGLRRRPTVERIARLGVTQWLRDDTLRRAQTSALIRLLTHAYAHVPFYRERFMRAGLSPLDVGSLDDLLKLPVLTHADVRADGDSRRSTAHPFPTVWKSTSGTTGRPFVFGYEPDSEWWRHAVKWRAYEWAGYRVGDKVMHLWGVPPTGREPWKSRAKVALDHRWKREICIPCAVLGETELTNIAGRIARERPRILVCYTQAGAALARFVNRRGLRDWSDMVVICGAERLYPHDRVELEAAFGPGVFETYGCREVMLIASECEAHDGLHTSMENLIVEIVVTGPNGTMRHAREGETGEVVVTDLHNFAMPFIRYANGDLATAGSSDLCRCGRGLARIASVEGRTADVLRDAHGALVSGVAFGYMFVDLERIVSEFQIVQRADLSVTLRVVTEGPLHAAVRERLRQSCRRFLHGIDVQVEAVRELPAGPMGKRRLVISEHRARPCDEVAPPGMPHSPLHGGTRRAG
jgi:phenylacetate-CoA ligase